MIELGCQEHSTDHALNGGLLEALWLRLYHSTLLLYDQPRRMPLRRTLLRLFRPGHMALPILDLNGAGFNVEQTMLHAKASLMYGRSNQLDGAS